MIKKGQLLTFIGLLLLPLVSSSFQQALNTPSRLTEQATHSLILDVTRAGERLVAVGERGHIVFSDSQGATWQQANVPVSVTLTALSFIDDHEGWAVGHSGVILHSIDGGESWEKVFDGFMSSALRLESTRMNYDALKQELLEAQLHTDNERIQLLEESLEETKILWDKAQQDVDQRVAAPLFDIEFISAKEGFVVGADGLILQTQDRGKSWSPLTGRVRNPARSHWNALRLVNDQYLLLMGEQGMAYLSEDKGDSWTRLNINYTGTLYGVAIFEKSQQWLLFGSHGQAFLTSDLGGTWHPVVTKTSSHLYGGFEVDEESVVLVGNEGALVIAQLSGYSMNSQPIFSSLVRKGRLAKVGVADVGSHGYFLIGEGGLHLLKKLPLSQKSRVTTLNASLP